MFTGSPPSASVLVRTFILSICQNFIWLSSPTAKKCFFVVSNCTMPADFFLNPEYVLFIAPSLSFHSTKYGSPSLLVPHENNLRFNAFGRGSAAIHTSVNEVKYKIKLIYLPASISTVEHCGAPLSRSIIINPRSHQVI